MRRSGDDVLSVATAEEHRLSQCASVTMRRKQSRNVVRWYRLLPKNVVELSRSGPNMALLGFRRRQHGRRLASTGASPHPRPMPHGHPSVNETLV